MKRILLLGLVFLAACSKGAPGSQSAAPANLAASGASSAAPPPPAGPNAKLARIFTPDMLGANLAFLEAITGPAFKTDGVDRTYKVGDCTVVVGSTAGKVDSLGVIGYSEQCSFNIAQYFAGGYDHPVPSVPTFADIRRGLGGDYEADCLRLCGNAADPVVSLNYAGSHADNFNQLYASVSVREDPVLAAYEDWGDKLVARYGEDGVVNRAYVGGDSLQAVADKDFGPLRPTTIRVGQNLIEGAD